MNRSDSESTSYVARRARTHLREQVQQLQELAIRHVAGDLAATALEEAALGRGKRVCLLLRLFLLVGVTTSRGRGGGGTRTRRACRTTSTRRDVLGLHTRLVRRVRRRIGLGGLRLDHGLTHLADQHRRLVLELARQEHHELLDEVVVPSEQGDDLRVVADQRAHLLDHEPHVLLSGLVVLQDGHELVVCVVLVVGEAGLDERHVLRRHLLFVRNLATSHVSSRDPRRHGDEPVDWRRDGRLDGLLTCQVHARIGREELCELGEQVAVALEDLLNPRDNRAVADSGPLSETDVSYPFIFSSIIMERKFL